MDKKFSLKDHLFNLNKVSKIAGEIHNTYPAFNKDGFIEETVRKFPELELKERISWIAENLRNYLPNNYQEAVNILIKSLPIPNDPSLRDNDFGDFIYAPYGEFIARNGCNKHELEFSLKALREITMRFSAEDAIRYFINSFPSETIRTLEDWSEDNNYHVRRLCSEGTRAKLPWSAKINIRHDEPLKILDKLYFDQTRFVTRSVANHLNDISRIEPDLVIKTLKKWQDSGKQEEKEMAYITRHSLRTLIKQGYPDAIKLLGYSPTPKATITDFTAKDQVAMNSNLEFSFIIKAQQDEKLIIDYAIYFQNKLGKNDSKKVFKLKQIDLKAGNKAEIKKKHLMRQFMTTRTLYEGIHKLEIQINGISSAKKHFILREI